MFAERVDGRLAIWQRASSSRLLSPSTRDATHERSSRAGVSRENLALTIQEALALVKPLLDFAGIHAHAFRMSKAVMLEANHELIRHALANLLICMVDDDLDDLEVRVESADDGVRIIGCGRSRSSDEANPGNPSVRALTKASARLRRAIATKDIDASGGTLRLHLDSPLARFQIQFDRSPLLTVPATEDRG